MDCYIYIAAGPAQHQVGVQYVAVILWMSSPKKVFQFVKHAVCQAVPGIGYPEMNNLDTFVTSSQVHVRERSGCPLKLVEHGSLSPTWRSKGGFLELSLERSLKLAE